MTSYRVTWEIDIEDVDTPEDAAREALKIQQDRESMATIFSVDLATDRPNVASRARWTVDTSIGQLAPEDGPWRNHREGQVYGASDE